jgi:hypothetical protein
MPNTSTASPNYIRITGAGTYVLHGGSNALLRYITVSTSGSTSAKVVVYDNTVGSGTVICSIDASTQTGTYQYDAVVKKGITVVVTGSTTDINVVWTASS